MRVPPFLLFALLAAGPAACNGMGGSETLGTGTPEDFTIASRTPRGSSSGVPVTTTIVVTFTSAIDPTSITPGVLTLNNSSFGTYSIEGSKLTFTPAGDLDPGVLYEVALSPDIRGINRVPLGAVPPWGFKTAGSHTPPPDTGAASPPRPR